MKLAERVILARTCLFGDKAAIRSMFARELAHKPRKPLTQTHPICAAVLRESQERAKAYAVNYSSEKTDDK